MTPPPAAMPAAAEGALRELRVLVEGKAQARLGRLTTRQGDGGWRRHPMFVSTTLGDLWLCWELRLQENCFACGCARWYGLVG